MICRYVILCVCITKLAKGVGGGFASVSPPLYSFFFFFPPSIFQFFIFFFPSRRALCSHTCVRLGRDNLRLVVARLCCASMTVLQSIRLSGTARCADHMSLFASERRGLYPMNSRTLLDLVSHSSQNYLRQEYNSYNLILTVLSSSTFTLIPPRSRHVGLGATDHSHCCPPRMKSRASLSKNSNLLRGLGRLGDRFHSANFWYFQTSSHIRVKFFPKRTLKLANGVSNNDGGEKKGAISDLRVCFS